jgi:hypothetical protein
MTTAICALRSSTASAACRREVGPLDRRHLEPLRLRARGHVDHRTHLLAARVREATYRIPGRRVYDIERLPEGAANLIWLTVYHLARCKENFDLPAFGQVLDGLLQVVSHEPNGVAHRARAHGLKQETVLRGQT